MKMQTQHMGYERDERRKVDDYSQSHHKQQVLFYLLALFNLTWWTSDSHLWRLNFWLKLTGERGEQRWLGNCRQKASKTTPTGESCIYYIRYMLILRWLIMISMVSVAISKGDTWTSSSLHINLSFFIVDCDNKIMLQYIAQTF